MDIASIAAFDVEERRVLASMLERRINSPATTSMGRLFDAVSSLVGLRQVVRHEGQAAMELEFSARRAPDSCGGYTIRSIEHEGLTRLDWEDMIKGILDDLAGKTPAPIVARRFHNALGEAVALAAHSIGCEKVALTGGCFQNRLLLEICVTHLRTAGFRPYWHQRVPPNDGGISLGQIAAAQFELAAHGRTE
jgi:hydrogenase maturation protein HypF